VPGVRPAPDLVAREVNPTEPNRLWTAALTEIPTWELTLSLAAIIDRFSRRCAGWAMAEHVRAELVVEGLEMAVWQRKPAPGLIHHCDQGSRYTALIFGRRCHQAGIDRSMGARGCALDNAVSEAFFASLKKETLNRRAWPTRQAARNAVFAWSEGWDNRRRLHSTLDHPLAPRLREQNSQTARYRPRRFAARTHIRDDQGEGCLDQPQRVQPERIPAWAATDRTAPARRAGRPCAGRSADP
jgi:putative transposase